MHRSHLLALCVGTFVAATSMGARKSPQNIATAQVRFANRLSGDRTSTLASNGVVLFADVAPGATSAYLLVSDSLSKLTLRASQKDSAVATTTYLFVTGSYYTVSATLGNGDHPMLSVERDRPPGDSTPPR